MRGVVRMRWEMESGDISTVATPPALERSQKME
jgi:hypothetical protein